MSDNSDSITPSAAVPPVSPGCVYEDVVFENWNEVEIDASRAEFVNCSFVNCRVQKWVAKSATFEDCRFQDCDLTNASILDARFIDSRFAGCKLLGWRWPDARSPILITLDACQCSESSFFGLQLKKLKMTDCNFTNADFAEAKMSHVTMKGCDFNGARFHNTDLSHADFSTARNYHIDVRANSVQKAKFSLPEAVSLLEGLGINLV